MGAWNELPDAHIVFVCDRSIDKAAERAARFGVPHFGSDLRLLLQRHEVDAVDIITDVDSHEEMVEQAASAGKHVICQKPMGADFATASRMVAGCAQRNVRFFVHENYRWQTQIRRLKQILDSGAIGRPFRARLAFNTAYPVFVNQPALAQLSKFALTDQGSHQFDLCRFLFGEVANLRCVTQQITPGICGEDLATTLMQMQSGMTVTSEISFASLLAREAFPQTRILVEGSAGSVEVAPGPEILVTDRAGVRSETVRLQRFAWQHPDYSIEPPSIVACNRDILEDLLGGKRAETTGQDNLETVRLVYAAYESAQTGEVVRVSHPNLQSGSQT